MDLPAKRRPDTIDPDPAACGPGPGAGDRSERLSVAVLLPCYNEEQAIAATIEGFRQALPRARIYVYDNNSTDRTVEVARAAGAIVRSETRQGKGHVVRRMLADVEADIYVMADGDATYDATAAPLMVQRLLEDELDMVVGRRQDTSVAAYRPGHRLGNLLLTGFLALLFGRHFSDVLSGYRVFSHRFAKTFPSLSSGFEIETEISVHALRLRMSVAEVDTVYNERPTGSVSKLSTYRDGWRILGQMISLFRQEHPLAFFGIIGGTLALASILLAIPIVLEFMATGLVPRFPTAILCVGLMIVATLSAACGLILDTVTRGRMEARRLAYLGCPRRTGAPPSAEQP